MGAAPNGGHSVRYRFSKLCRGSGGVLVEGVLDFSRDGVAEVRRSIADRYLADEQAERFVGIAWPEFRAPPASRWCECVGSRGGSPFVGTRNAHRPFGGDRRAACCGRARAVRLRTEPEPETAGMSMFAGDVWGIVPDLCAKGVGQITRLPSRLA
jgi:hypothetical protein